MASEIAKRIDEVIKLGIAPLLKEHGFRKKGRNFHNTVGEAIQVVNIQPDKWNEGDRGGFTANLGIYFQAVAEIAERLAVDGAPKEYECTVRTRLGHLLPEPDDKWWKLGKNTDDEQFAKDVAETINQYGLPWLATVSTRQGLRACFESGEANFYPHPRIPIALEILDGNKKKATTLLRAQLDKATNLGFAKQMTEWGRKQGLL